VETHGLALARAEAGMTQPDFRNNLVVAVGAVLIYHVRNKD
jgi:hypothetical protein